MREQRKIVQAEQTQKQSFCTPDPTPSFGHSFIPQLYVAARNDDRSELQ